MADLGPEPLRRCDGLVPQLAHDELVRDQLRVEPRLFELQRLALRREILDPDAALAGDQLLFARQADDP